MMSNTPFNPIVDTPLNFDVHGVIASPMYEDGLMVQGSADADTGTFTYMIDHGIGPPVLLTLEDLRALLSEALKVQPNVPDLPVNGFAWDTIEEYEELLTANRSITPYKANEAFRIGWDMARTTNQMLNG